MPVNDGVWHTVVVDRRGRYAKVALDTQYTADAYAPGTNTIINLRSNDVHFGAIVHAHATLYGYESIKQGFVGCLGRVLVDGYALPRAQPGLKMYNVKFGCPDSFIHGVCSGQPCHNFGTCAHLSTIHAHLAWLL
jgi:hypothetical protein